MWEGDNLRYRRIINENIKHQKRSLICGDSGCADEGTAIYHRNSRVLLCDPVEFRRRQYMDGEDNFIFVFVHGDGSKTGISGRIVVKYMFLNALI